MGTVHRVNWANMRVGVKDYENRTFQWWHDRLHNLSREGKWSALLIVLTVLQEAGALAVVSSFSSHRGFDVPGFAHCTRMSAKER